MAIARNKCPRKPIRRRTRTPNEGGLAYSLHGRPGSNAVLNPAHEPISGISFSSDGLVRPQLIEHALVEAL